MISLSPEDVAWREQWKADIARRAHTEMPALLRSVYSQRLQPLVRVSTIVAPTTPLPNTGDIPRLRETAMISVVKLLRVDVRATKELVSSAVRWFYNKYGCLPDVVRVNPMRYLTITQADLFAVDCEDLGCYTVAIESDAHLNSDVVQLRGLCQFWEKIEDSYL
jgi:hypothetical protein